MQLYKLIPESSGKNLEENKNGEVYDYIVQAAGLFTHITYIFSQGYFPWNIVGSISGQMSKWQWQQRLQAYMQDGWLTKLHRNTSGKMHGRVL